MGEDCQVSFTPEQLAADEAVYNFNRTWKYGTEAPGVSVFKKDVDEATGKSTLYQTYSAYAAALGGLSSVLSLLDLSPEGRAEDGRNMYWVKHKEAY